MPQEKDKFEDFTTAHILDLMRRAHHEISGLSKLPEEYAAKRPAEDGWSVREILIHLNACERILHDRLSTLLATPETTLHNIDERQFAIDQGLPDETTEDIRTGYLRLLEGNRDVLQGLRDEQWERSALHDEYGRVTVRWFAAFIADHTDSHLGQIEKTLRAVGP